MPRELTSPVAGTVTAIAAPGERVRARRRRRGDEDGARGRSPRTAARSCASTSPWATGRRRPAAARAGARGHVRRSPSPAAAARDARRRARRRARAPRRRARRAPPRRRRAAPRAGPAHRARERRRPRRRRQLRRVPAADLRRAGGAAAEGGAARAHARRRPGRRARRHRRLARRRHVLRLHGARGHAGDARASEEATGCSSSPSGGGCRSCCSPRAAAGGRATSTGRSWPGSTSRAFHLFARLSGLVPLVGIAGGYTASPATPRCWAAATW